MEQYCEICGCRIDPQTGLCPNCANHNNEKPDKKKAAKKAVIIAVIVVALLAIAVAVVFFLSSDEQKSDAPSGLETGSSEEELRSVQAADSSVQAALQYEMREEYFEYKLPSGELFFSSTISYPYFLGTSALEMQINERYAGIIEEYRQKCAEDKTSWYETVVDMNETNKMPFYYDLEATVSYNQNGYLSLLEWIHDWPGGAHPYHSERGLTYNLATGEEIPYSEFFIGTEDEIYGYLSLQYNTDLYGMYYNNNWYKNCQYVLTPDGLCFYINVGDAVARYEIVIPYSEGKAPLIDLSEKSEATSSELTEEKIKALFIEANYLYVKWVGPGFGPGPDFDDRAPGNSMYGKATNGDLHSVEEIESALSEYFSKENCQSYIDENYVMYNGELYANLEMGQEGGIRPVKFSLIVNSLTDDSCDFTVVSYYDYESAAPESSDYTLKKIDGKWVFVGEFAANTALYADKDLEWISLREKTDE